MIRSQRLGEGADALELYLTGSETREDQRLSQHGRSTANHVRHPSRGLLSLDDERARANKELRARRAGVRLLFKRWKV